VRDAEEAALKRLELIYNAPNKPSIAVLPFENLSGDRDQEYFADGVVEEMITALSRFRGLFVIARNSGFAYKGRAVDVKQVGRELGCAISSKAASERQAVASGLLGSSLTPPQERICGLTDSMANWRIFSIYKIK
jgi:hypothetical protein